MVVLMQTGTTFDSRVLTRKGQITIPLLIRQQFDLEEGDRVDFVMDKREIRLIPQKSTVLATAGIFKSKKRAHSAEKLRELAERSITRE